MSTTTATKKRTANTRRPSVTPEQRKEQAAALHESIAAQVEQLRDSDRWTAFLQFAGAFHTYSLNNVLLILAQRPDAERVAGFRKWQALGRQVRKGEKSLRIFGYSTKKVTEQDENGEDVEKRYPRFPILPVFDIAQTDPIDPDAADQSTLTAPLTGTDDHGVIGTLTAHLVADGWSVEHTEPGEGRNGFTDPAARRVVIGSHLAPKHSAKTLIHELAHILLGHTDDLTEYAEHRGLMETEAESVAYVVAGLVGFDTAAYSIGYVAGWSDADADLIRSTAARVLTAAHQVAAILTPADVDAEDGDDADPTDQ
ncbi:MULTISPECIES: ArdC-like ssDNA-binding domain-containing protein [unclassified Curtobacterium]|uniref:ArdC-like ssDNA-binding domain-containing protein n=1 Tax=unclassified Curtobacterium TaxID=257496 RepID=UPI00226B7A3F|nr:MULTISPECIES: ArdC-like ssDNA-binding domain-containing protein [unclassified Curtobacterium]